MRLDSASKAVNKGREEKGGLAPRFRAFTLVEVIVSVSIFATVMLVATGSVFSIVEANKKTHALKSVMTNLNFALESMMREIRVGLRYACGAGGDCPTTPGSIFTFKANRDVDGDSFYSISDNNDRIEYSLVSVGGINRIQKRIFSSGATYHVTAPEINIDSMKFYVIGSGTTDQKQPKVVIIIQGYAGSGKTKSSFNIETTISQRAIDS